ncbi:MAG: hypothetical protein H9535_03665, partial [Ignavibacteria bacterium]|nr:hypothetical protein [Ignavibacteria bacterium]
MKIDAIPPDGDRERLEHLMISILYDDVTESERRELDGLLRRFPSALDDLIALQDLRRFITKPSTMLQASEEFYSRQLGVLEAALQKRQEVVPRAAASRTVSEGLLPKQVSKPLIRTSELKRTIPIATRRGFLGALFLLTFLFSGYSLFLVVNTSGVSRGPAINKMKLTNLPPPPQQ